MATAVLNKGKDSPCIIWETRDIGMCLESQRTFAVEATSNATAASPVQTAEVSAASPVASRFGALRFGALGNIVLNVLVTAICAALLAYVIARSKHDDAIVNTSE